MKKELTDLKKVFDNNDSWLGHLILEGTDRESIIKLASQEKYDIGKCHVVLTIDGITLRNEEFEVFMDYISDRYHADLKEEKDAFNNLVHRKAEELMYSKLGNIRDKLDDIEQNCIDMIEDYEG